MTDDAMRGTLFDHVDPKVVIVFVFSVSLVLAFVNRFVQDDAFISFRYAYNLVNGEGLVWNPGERVEGYTNFLWTLLMGIPLAVGRDPVVFSQILGLLAFAGSLIVTFRLSRLLYRSDMTAVLTVFLLGTNYSFSAYATGGLETQLQTFLIAGVAYLSLRGVASERVSVGRAAALSLVCAAALLTRLDSAVAIAPAWLFFVWESVRSGRRIAPVAAALLPGAVVVGSWLAWKYSYYGALLPNSYHAKAASSVTSTRQGFLYLYHFARSYLLFPIVALAPFRAKTVLEPVGARVLVAALLLWALYIVRIGGDFMEFRFIVPVMPLGMILAAALIASFRRRAIQIALAFLVVAGSLWHSVKFDLTDRIGPIKNLRGHIEDEYQNWDEIGRTFGRLFGGEPEEVVIATTAAGAIPYYSRLSAVDMYGINDRHVARYGLIVSRRPGHQRMATHRYLLDRGVNLVISHPRAIPIETPPRESYTTSDLRRMFVPWRIDPTLITRSPGILEIPLGDRYKLAVLYLAPNAAVDRVIARHRLRVCPVRDPPRKNPRR